MSSDIRELIQVDDVMEDPSLRFGPNGGLVFCMEYLANNSDWLEESLGHVDDDYILFDCPGERHHRKRSREHRFATCREGEEPGCPPPWCLSPAGADTFRSVSGWRISGAAAGLLVPLVFTLLSFSGQIELYTHLPVMRQLVERLQQWEFRVCGVFLVDSQFMVESYKARVHPCRRPGGQHRVTVFSACSSSLESWPP